MLIRRAGVLLGIVVLLGVLPAAFGSSPSLRLAGSLCNQSGTGAAPTRNKVAMAVTPDGQGYWLMQDDGGIFPYGDATGWGSAGGTTLASLMVAMAPTPDGRGYWLVERRGMVWTFGDAACYGGSYDTGATDIVGMAATPSGHGYWLVEQNGGIWPYGDATSLSFGCIPCQGVTLNDVIGMAATPDGHGYWIAERNGGVWPYGNACGCGTATSSFPMVAFITPPGSAQGYLFVDSIGGVFPVGAGSGFLGSLPGNGYNVTDISAAGLTMDGHGMYFLRKMGQVIPLGNAGNLQ
jgi:hypothetical protein